MATDYAGLVPRGVAQNFLDLIEVQSVALRLGNVMRMSEATEVLPIASFLPQVGFTTTRYGGRKPATKIEWSAQNLIPEEIAATIPIPENWIRDAGFDVWGSVRTALLTSLAIVLDRAILFGDGEPPNYPPNGVAGPPPAPLTGADALAAIDAGLAAVEESGLVPNGIASSPKINSALRQEFRTIAVPPTEAPPSGIYGLPVATTPAWDSTKGDAIVGDWTRLAIGVREDISFRTTDTGVLQDGAGAIVANMFQDNLVALKVWMKVAVAIGVPLKADGSGPSVPFQAVDWTAP